MIDPSESGAEVSKHVACLFDEKNPDGDDRDNGTDYDRI
jgi:hypothetical protein